MASTAPQMRFLTVQEVADLMRVSSMTVYRMVHAGDMPAIRFGRSFRIPEAAVSHLTGQLDEHRVDRAG